MYTSYMRAKRTRQKKIVFLSTRPCFSVIFVYRNILIFYTADTFAHVHINQISISNFNLYQTMPRQTTAAAVFLQFFFVRSSDRQSYYTEKKAHTYSHRIVLAYFRNDTAKNNNIPTAPSKKPRSRSFILQKANAVACI